MLTVMPFSLCRIVPFVVQPLAAAAIALTALCACQSDAGDTSQASPPGKMSSLPAPPRAYLYPLAQTTNVYEDEIFLRVDTSATPVTVEPQTLEELAGRLTLRRENAETVAITTETTPNSRSPYFTEIHVQSAEKLVDGWYSVELDGLDGLSQEIESSEKTAADGSIRHRF